MKEYDHTIIKHWFESEIMPGVCTQNADWAKAINWADEQQPIIYKILTENRSKVLGGGSNFFLGGRKSVVRVRDAQGNKCREIDYDAVLSRLCQVHNTLTDPIRRLREAPFDIFRWRIEFTLAHCQDKHFRGGFFQQWDEMYSRNCIDLDYTLDTFQGVLQHFLEWTKRTPFYKTVRVTVDDKIVFGGDPAAEEEL